MGRTVLTGAFLLLDTLMTRGELSLSQLATRSSIPKTTVHRLLDQLAGLGVVERTGDRYRIGAHAFQLGQAWEPYPGLLQIARPLLRQLSAVTRTSTVLAVPRQGQPLIAAASVTNAEDGLALRPGATVPAGVDFVTAPVQAPGCKIVGTVAAVLPDRPRDRSATDAAVRTAKAITTALCRQRVRIVGLT